MFWKLFVKTSDLVYHKIGSHVRMAQWLEYARRVPRWLWQKERALPRPAIWS